jgi:hypothetical protein
MATFRAYPIFEDIDPCTLLVDEGYQRDSSERSLKLVRRIIAGWDWAKFKAPVAVMTDAGLELLDGQHTAIAAATHPDIQTIPVMIVDVKQREERAAAFIGHNKDRVAVTAVQLHVAAVAAGDAVANAVDRVCKAAGVLLLRGSPGSGRYGVGDTMAVAAIGAVIRDQGEERSTKILAALVAGKLAPITGLHIKAAELLLFDPEYSDQITVEALAHAAAGLGKKAEAEADVFRATHPSVPKWKALAIVWFKNRRGKSGALKTEVSGISGQLKSESSPADLRTSSGKLIENITHRPSSISAISAHRPPVVDSGKADSRAALSGWKPGIHLLRCSGCDEKYQGDRRSRSCADCSYGCTEAVSA